MNICKSTWKCSCCCCCSSCCCGRCCRQLYLISEIQNKKDQGLRYHCPMYCLYRAYTAYIAATAYTAYTVTTKLAHERTLLRVTLCPRICLSWTVEPNAITTDTRGVGLRSWNATSLLAKKRIDQPFVKGKVHTLPSRVGHECCGSGPAKHSRSE